MGEDKACFWGGGIHAKCKSHHCAFLGLPFLQSLYTNAN